MDASLPSSFPRGVKRLLTLAGVMLLGYLGYRVFFSEEGARPSRSATDPQEEAPVFFYPPEPSGGGEGRS
jgi:threonine/homoserine/homoserine lactone efflux protein